MSAILIRQISRVYKDVFGYKTFVVPVYGDPMRKSIVFAMVGNNLVSLPHFSYSLSLADSVTDPDQGIYFTLESGKITCSDPNIKWEIRSFDKQSDYYNDEKVVSFLKLEVSEEKQWKYFSSSLRNNVKKAIKLNVTAYHGGIEYLNAFYYVYSKNMHDLGSPCYGINFFRELISSFPDDSRIIVVKVQGRPVGCSFLLRNGDYSEICWASSLKEFNKLNTNYLVYWESIKSALEFGCTFFSFGRSTQDSPSYKFKHHWRPVEKTLYFNYSHPKGRSIRSLHILSNIWKIIPYRLTLLLGPFAMKYLY